MKVFDFHIFTPVFSALTDRAHKIGAEVDFYAKQWYAKVPLGNKA